jgi:integrase
MSLPTGIKRLPSGRYEARALLPGKRWARRRFDTAQEAANWRNRALATQKAVKAGRAPEFSSALDQFEEWAAGRRPATAKWTKWICNRLRKVEYFQKRLDLVNAQDVERWRRELASEGLAPRTVDHYTERLKRLFSLAVEWGILESSPAAKVRLSRENPERVRYLTQAEEKRLLKAASPALRRLILVALHTGARRGELLELRWGGINLEVNTATIPASVTKGKRDRVLYLNARTLRALGKAKKAEAYVFPSPTGKRWWRAKQAWEAAVVAARLEDFHFHDLRHTFASRLVMAGEDLYTVSRLLGHASVAQTQRYAHLAPGKLASAVEVLAKPLAKRPAKPRLVA